MKDKELHKNKGGFKIPEGYFDSLEEKLLKNQTSPLPEEEGFKVPDSYFDNLTERILVNTQQHTKPRVPVINLKSRKGFYYIGYAVAAGFALLILLTVLPKSETKIGWKDVASADLESYVEEGYLSLNAYDYITIYEDVDLSKIDMEEKPIKSEELIDYLYENVNAYDNFIIEN